MVATMDPMGFLQWTWMSDGMVCIVTRNWMNCWGMMELGLLDSDVGVEGEGDVITGHLALEFVGLGG